MLGRGASHTAGSRDREDETEGPQVGDPGGERHKLSRWRHNVGTPGAWAADRYEHDDHARFYRDAMSWFPGAEGVRMSEEDGRLEARSVGELAETLAEPGPGPAAGSVAAVASALAAGLAEKTAHSAGAADIRRGLAALRASALTLADEDTAAFAAFLEDGSKARREEIVNVPVRIAEIAARITGLVADLRPTVPRAVHADVSAVALLAAAATRCVAAILEANLEDPDDPRLAHVHELIQQATTATNRASASASLRADGAASDDGAHRRRSS